MLACVCYCKLLLDPQFVQQCQLRRNHNNMPWKLQCRRLQTVVRNHQQTPYHQQKRGERGKSQALAGNKKDNVAVLEVGLANGNAAVNAPNQQMYDSLFTKTIVIEGARKPAEVIQEVKEGSGKHCSYISPFDKDECRTALINHGKCDAGQHPVCMHALDALSWKPCSSFWSSLFWWCSALFIKCM